MTFYFNAKLKLLEMTSRAMCLQIDLTKDLLIAFIDETNF